MSGYPGSNGDQDITPVDPEIWQDMQQAAQQQQDQQQQGDDAK